MKAPLVIAHRGASGERPENTMAAFELAIEQSADMIEIDLHLSRDSVVMIHHDASLERLGEPGEISDYTADELAQMNAAPGAPHAASMPTLKDVLDRFADRIDFNLEVKTGTRGAYDGIEDIVLEAVEERRLLGRMLFSSFDDDVLARIRERNAEARLAVLVSSRAPLRIWARAQRLRAEAVNPHVPLVRSALVERAHASGFAVYPYTEDDPAGMTRLLDAGVDGIFTNHPARLRGLLRGREESS